MHTILFGVRYTLLFATLLLASCGGGGGDAGGGVIVPPPPSGGGTGQPSLVFIVQPTPQQVNTNLAPAVQLELRDANGARISGGPGSGLQSDSTVSLTISNGPSGGSLQGTTMRSSASGVAAFPDLRLSVPGDYVLRALSPGRPQVDSIQFTITAPGVPPPPPPPPTGPTQLAFVVQPMDSNLGLNFAVPPTVEIRDANGVRVTSAAVIVTLSLEGGPAGAALIGSTTATAIAGTASFSGLSVGTVGTSYRLRASSQGLAQAISTTFEVFPAAGPPTQLRFMDPIPDAPVRGYIDPVRVEVLDANGVRVTDAQVDVTVELESVPSQVFRAGHLKEFPFDDPSLPMSNYYAQVASLWDPQFPALLPIPLMDVPVGARQNPPQTGPDAGPAIGGLVRGAAYNPLTEVVWLSQLIGSGPDWELIAVDVLTWNSSVTSVMNSYGLSKHSPVCFTQAGVMLRIQAESVIESGYIEVFTHDFIGGHASLRALGTATLAGELIADVTQAVPHPSDGHIYLLCRLGNRTADRWMSLVKMDPGTFDLDLVCHFPQSLTPIDMVFTDSATLSCLALDLSIAPGTSDAYMISADITSVSSSLLQPQMTIAVTLSNDYISGDYTCYVHSPIRGVTTVATIGGIARIEGLSLDVVRSDLRLRATAPGFPQQLSSQFSIVAPTTAPSLSFKVQSQVAQESIGMAYVEVSLSQVVQHAVSVHIELSGDAVGSGRHHSLRAPQFVPQSWSMFIPDFNTRGGMTVTIPPGNIGIAIPIAITDDSIPETNRTLNLELIRPFGATLGNNTTHALQIIDND